MRFLVNQKPEASGLALKILVRLYTRVHVDWQCFVQNRNNGRHE